LKEGEAEFAKLASGKTNWDTTKEALVKGGAAAWIALRGLVILTRRHDYVSQKKRPGTGKINPDEEREKYDSGDCGVVSGRRGNEKGQEEDRGGDARNVLGNDPKKKKTIQYI